MYVSINMYIVMALVVKLNPFQCFEESNTRTESIDDIVYTK